MKKTEKEIDNYYNSLMNKFKQDPLYEIKVEFGGFLLRHIEDLTTQERRRYDELNEILSKKDKII